MGMGNDDHFQDWYYTEEELEKMEKDREMEEYYKSKGLNYWDEKFKKSKSPSPSPCDSCRHRKLVIDDIEI